MKPIYIAPRVPGATETTEWTSICHSRQPFVWISHETLRSTSRWVSVPRVKQFRVTHYHHGRFGISVGAVSYHATLAAAQTAAREVAQ